MRVRQVAAGVTFEADYGRELTVAEDPTLATTATADTAARLHSARLPAMRIQHANLRFRELEFSELELAALIVTLPRNLTVMSIRFWTARYQH